MEAMESQWNWIEQIIVSIKEVDSVCVIVCVCFAGAGAAAGAGQMSLISNLYNLSQPFLSLTKNVKNKIE